MLNLQQHSNIITEEWRTQLSEKVNPSDFLTTMARHDCDVTIVEKCCVVVGNLVLSGKKLTYT